MKDVDDAEDFKITLKCMQNIGFTQQEIDSVIDTVVGILILGNIEFITVSKSGVGDQS